MDALPHATTVKAELPSDDDEDNDNRFAVEPEVVLEQRDDVDTIAINQESETLRTDPDFDWNKCFNSVPNADLVKAKPRSEGDEDDDAIAIKLEPEIILEHPADEAYEPSFHTFTIDYLSDNGQIDGSEEYAGHSFDRAIPTYETDEQRAVRLAKKRAQYSRRQQKVTDEQLAVRREYVRQHYHRSKVESPQDYLDKRRTQRAECQRLRRMNETPEQRERRLANHRLYFHRKKEERKQQKIGEGKPNP